MHIAFTGVVTVLIATLATLLLALLFSRTPWNGLGFKLAIWGVLIFVWAVTSLVIWFTWHKKYYEITKDAIIVYSGSTFKFGTTQTIYRYESIISIRLNQNFLGRQYGYGDILLTIPKIEGEVAMKDIKHPQQQLLDIQTYMRGRSDATSLIT